MATEEVKAAAEVAAQVGRALEQVIEANSFIWVTLLLITESGQPVTKQSLAKALTILRDSKEIMQPDDRPDLPRFDHAVIDAILQKLEIASGKGSHPKPRWVPEVLEGGKEGGDE